jgi:hypothetical protein
MLMAMKISLTTTLSCSVNEAWAALHDPSVFQKVSQPFLKFRAESETGFPARWVSGHSYVVKAFALGVIPMGTQEINPHTSEEGMARTFQDRGRGLSGTLASVRSFHHTMTVEPTGVGPTTLRDELEFDAGILTPVLWVGFRLFWWWRHTTMRKLSPSWRSERGAEWDARYQGASLWSGKVNTTLEAIATPLTPGTALDIGAGEGGDALWLAEHGWQVNATDISVVALERGETERQKRVTGDHLPRMVTWFALDAAQEPLPSPPKKYDLVLSFFSHFEETTRHAVWAAMADQVAPGGLLVIVGHSPEDLLVGVRRPPENLLFDDAELLEHLAGHFAEVEVKSWPRTQKTSDGTEVPVADIVAIARR